MLFFLHFTCIFRDNLYLCKIITVIIIMTIIINELNMVKKISAANFTVKD